MRPKHILTGLLLTATLAAAPDAYGQISYTEQGLTIGTATRPAGTDGQIVISTAKGLEWLNGSSGAKFTLDALSYPCISSSARQVYFRPSSTSLTLIDIVCQSVYMKSTEKTYVPASGSAMDLVKAVRVVADPSLQPESSEIAPLLLAQDDFASSLPDALDPADDEATIDVAAMVNTLIGAIIELRNTVEAQQTTIERLRSEVTPQSNPNTSQR